MPGGPHGAYIGESLVLFPPVRAESRGANLLYVCKFCSAHVLYAAYTYENLDIKLFCIVLCGPK